VKWEGSFGAFFDRERGVETPFGAPKRKPERKKNDPSEHPVDQRAGIVADEKVQGESQGESKNTTC